ncbi:MAG: SDR family NAD(P)-dependent oxidoreductase, partial [Chitinivibrionales bacterium]|nr:SDR family NAD(P)-dependent oxidoreductase [Chitinivibrionales bacterium]MBD3356925.1 SDR family NAD(P)-dependent oxidoreductase [Chitinivibrionales bacterium]
VTNHGKVNRDALPPAQKNLTTPSEANADRVIDQLDPAKPHIESLESVLTKVKDEMKGFLECAELAVDDDLFDHGATSLTLVNLSQKLNEMYEIVVPIEVFLDNPTVQGLAEFLHRRLAEKATEKAKLKRQSAEVATKAAAEDQTKSDSEVSDEPAASLPEIEETYLQRADFVPDAYVRSSPSLGFSDSVISFANLSKLLGLLRGISLDGKDKYLYPSAGGLNAVQTYIAVKENSVEGLNAGTYYYHPIQHSLIPLVHDFDLENGAFHQYYHEAFETAGFLVFFIAEMKAILPVYAATSRVLVTVDCGYMEELLLSRMGECGLRLCPVEGVDFSPIRRHFKLNESHEYVHCLIGGAPSANDGGAPSAQSLEQFIERSEVGLRDHFSEIDDRSYLQTHNSEAKMKDFKFMLKDEHDRFEQEQHHIRKIDGITEIRLADSPHPEMDYRLRGCRREYLRDSIPFKEFGDFLSLLRTDSNRGTRLYPSTDNRYAVKAYLYIKKDAVEGFREGIYCYEPDKHTLRLVCDKLSKKVKPSYTPFNRPHYQASKFCMFLIADLGAFRPTYGDEALQLATLETGYMGQLLMDHQSEFNIGLCPIGGLRFDRIEDDFKLPLDHMLIHGFTAGYYTFEGSRSPSLRLSAKTIAPTSSVSVHSSQSSSGDVRPSADSAIAIIGASGRFPGSKTLETYWKHLRGGDLLIQEIPEQRRSLMPTMDGSQRDPFYGGYLDDIDCFDNRLFKISPVEARTMDPQERLLLEVVWECLEDAGYSPSAMEMSAMNIGVFIGAMWNDYQQLGLDEWRNDGTIKAVTQHSALANRISYFFGLKGPSVVVDTSCSSALTALHLARESIRAGDCNAAIVGGVNIITHPFHTRILRELDLTSSDGTTRAFAQQGAGWTPGEGVGAILIRPHSTAHKCGDNIHAVIRSTHISHYGKSSRFGMPSSASQAASIATALERSECSPATIDYIETAATGSSVADASEVAALRKVFENSDGRRAPCPIGSVKPNVGHLESASFLSQLFKVIGQMKYEELAPTICEKPLNPFLGLEQSPFVIAEERMKWVPRSPANGRREKKRLRALINGFGATGSGGHVVLESPSSGTDKSTTSKGPFLIVCSALTNDQLVEYAERLHDFLKEESGAVPMVDLEFTLAAGRAELPERLALSVRDRIELIKKLEQFVQTKKECPGIFCGNSRTGKKSNFLIRDRSDLDKAARAWVAGATLEWEVYSTDCPKRISLPTYCFAKTRFWIDLGAEISGNGKMQRQNADTSPGTPRDGKPQNHKPNTFANASTGNEVGTLVKKIFAEVTEAPIGDIDSSTPLEDYGLNSIIVTKFNHRMAEYIENVSRTILYENQTLDEVVNQLVENHAFRITNTGTADDSSASGYDKYLFRQAQRIQRPIEKLQESASSPDIAIVGLSGRYPGAENLEQFWSNLKRGLDCISEIPADRWDYRPFYNSDPNTKGTTYSKWGGFLKDVDKFDPLFFGMTPREAETTDPQERLMLEIAWETLEDAGYTRKSLQRLCEGNVGVFVGVMSSEYQLFGMEETMNGNGATVSPSFGTIANRVSYFMNFRGPSMAVDTMCSSSLTSVHLAVESLKRGECMAALAGGVNLSMHPYKFIGQSRMRMASTDGRCRSFGMDGDGFVSGEGVGMVLLKPIDVAVRDRDRIYGLIKGTAVNHGGKTNGYTVPNPRRQAEVIREAVERSGIDPRSITYIEAHGTGTALGDPVEINGLTAAFKESRQPGVKRSIGSVKSNIGHLEGAAGIAAITKVLLQMRHKCLVPSIHAEPANPNINFADSPFRVQRDLCEWTVPLEPRDQQGRPFPRRSGISSFGAGGANAHVLLEEPSAVFEETHVEDGTLSLFVLSAKNKQRLLAYAKRMIEFLRYSEESASFADICYSSRIGREAMDERLAVVASTKSELMQRLQSYLADSPAEGLIIPPDERKVTQDKHTKSAKTKNIIPVQVITADDLYELAWIWVCGADLDWEQFGDESRRRRVKLPTYPFEKRRCWLSGNGGGFRKPPQSASVKPVLKSIDSPFDSGIVHRESIDPHHPIVSEHVIHGRNIFPGVGYLNIVCNTVCKLRKEDHILLENVRWMFPLEVNDTQKQLELKIQKNDSDLTYHILAQGFSNEIILNKGKIPGNGSAPKPKTKIIPLDTIKGACKKVVEHDEVYSKFAALGVQYGPYFRGIKKIWKNDNELVALLETPNEDRGNQIDGFFHTGFVDSALQSIICFHNQSRYSAIKANKVPISAKAVQFQKPLTSLRFAYVIAVGTDLFDVYITDAGGQARLCFQSVSLQEVSFEKGNTTTPVEPIYFTPQWKPIAIPPDESRRLWEASLAGSSSRLVIRARQTAESLESTLTHAPCAYTAGAYLEEDLHFSSLAGIEMPLRDLEYLDETLAGCDQLTEIIFEADADPEDADEAWRAETVINTRDGCVRGFFRLVKSLDERGYGQRQLRIAVITNNVHRVRRNDRVEPFTAGIVGMCNSLVHEYPRWNIRCFDFSRRDFAGPEGESRYWNAVMSTVHDTRFGNGDIIAVREGTYYKRALIPVTASSRHKSPFREGRTYLIAGGAGGISLAVCRQIAAMHRVRFVLLGKSDLDEQRKRKIRAIEELGSRVLYLKADIQDQNSMYEARRLTHETFGPIHGVIHSAAKLKDKLLRDMDEASFNEAYCPKTRGSVVLSKVLENEPLDFMLFFSSIQTFVSYPGQCNYAAGCAFKDAYSLYLNESRSYPVKSVNWGYWGSVGMVSGEQYRKRMAKQGIGSVEAPDGLTGIEHVLNNEIESIAVIRANRNALETIGVDCGNGRKKPSETPAGAPVKAISQVARYTHETLPHSPHRTKIPDSTAERNQTRAITPPKSTLSAEERSHRVHELIKSSIERAAGIGAEEINWDMQFSEFGVDSIVGVDLVNILNDITGISLKTSVLFDYPNVADLAKHLLENYDNAITAWLGATHKRADSQATPRVVNAPESGLVQALVLRRPMNIKDCQLEFKSVEEPGPREVQIKVNAFSLNFADLLCIRGLYPNMPPYPFTPGFEVSGIVVKTGSRVSRFTAGDEVIGVMGNSLGGHSSLVNADERFTVKKPEHCDFEEACAYPVVFLTTKHIFDKATMKPGEKILIQTAAGGVGLIALQFAQMYGAEVFATAGSTEKTDLLKKRGAHHVINYRQCDFAQEIQRLTDGYGVDVVINTLSDDNIQKGLNLLAPEGRYFEIAMTGLKSSDGFDLSKLDDNQQFYSIDMRKQMTRDPDRALESLEVMRTYLSEGKIKPVIGKRFALTDLFRAYKYLQDRKSIGKVVVSVPRVPPNYDRPITGQSTALESPKNEEGASERLRTKSEDIAIIGMSARFPGAKNCDEFWGNLKAGKCSIREIPADRWSIKSHYDADPLAPNKTVSKWGGVLEDVDMFDPLFFNMSGKEAEETDPQHRLFLEETWKALENAGYVGERLSDSVCGVFVGAVNGDYQTKMFYHDGAAKTAQSYWGNACSILAGRVSYFLNLKGPCMVVDTACSSASSAIHLACRSILANECEMAVAGGVSVCVTPDVYILASKAGMLSPTGECKAFDQTANGFVPGEGVGVLILKPLESALRDHDNIHAVIKGSNINQDGRTNGITAPSVKSQTELEASLYRKCAIDPRTIGYVEAHGTGTKLGDPLEIEALTNAFRQFTDAKGFC